MKQVVYLKTVPIQHPGEKGRELPLAVSHDFTQMETEHLFISASRMEHYFENVYRIEPVDAAYNEVMAAYADLCDRNENFRPEGFRNAKETAIRRIDGYMLEVDLFLKHWEWYLQDRDRSYKEKIKNGEKVKGGFKPARPYESGNYYLAHYKAHTSYAYDNNVDYCLLAILRNYLVHASGVVNCIHMGYQNVTVWCDRDLVTSNKIVSKNRIQILKQQPKQIDLIKIIRGSYPVIKELQGRLLMLLYDDQLVEDYDFLCSMYPRTVLIPSVAWFVVENTGIEYISDPPPVDGVNYIGGTFGVGTNYAALNWEGYKAVKEFGVEGVKHKDDAPGWL